MRWGVAGAILHKGPEATVAAKLPVTEGMKIRGLELIGYPFLYFRWELLFL